MKRELRFAIEVRGERDSPGRLRGVLMRYNEQASDRPEVFRAGALEYDQSAGIPINRQHQRGDVFMRAFPKTVGAEVRIDEQIPDSIQGRSIANELRAKVFTGMSVEFSPLEESMDGDVRVVRRARLLAAAVVDSPSYSGATVEVRGRSELEIRHDLWL